jgi:RNA polymerase sigma factor (sigma-70 family)
MPATGQLVTRLRDCIRALAPTPSSDAHLLDRYVRVRDESAFAELLHRHGRLVLGVVRRHLADRHAAEDVFQATFVALARQAARLRHDVALEGWLYTVAYRLARKEQARAVRRPQALLDDLPADDGAVAASDPLAQISGRELAGVIDDELARLPEHYRLPLVLCALEGLTRDAAAARLGSSLGTLRGRLKRGRELLRQRLTKRGLTVPAAMAAGLVVEPVGAVPPALISATTRAALAAPLAAAVPQKLLVVAAVLIAAFGLAGATFWLGSSGEDPPDRPAPQVAPARLDVDALGDPLPERALRRFGTARFRHGTQIHSFALSPDGTIAASGGLGEIRLWDAANGKLRRIFRGHSAWVFALGFSADGARLVSAGSEDNDHKGGKLIVWDLAAGKPLTTVPHPGWVRSAALTPDGKTVAMCCDDGTLHVLDADTGKVVHSLLGTTQLRLSRVAFSPDGKQLAAAGDNDTVCLWDVTTGAERLRLADVQGLQALAFSIDGKMLAAAQFKGMFEEGKLRLWDLATGRDHWTVALGSGKSFSAGVGALAFSPDGLRLACCDMGGTTEVRDAKTGKVLRAYKEGEAWMHGVAFAPDGRTIYAAGTDGRVQVWNVASGKERFPYDQHRGGVLGLSESPDGRTLATASSDCNIRLWDLATGKTRSVLSGHPRAVYSVQFFQGGQRLVSAGGDGAVRVWNAATGEQVQKLLGADKGWNARTALSPDGNLLAIGEVQGVRLWDLAAGKELRQLKGHEGYIIDLSFSADGDYLTTASHAYSDGMQEQHQDWSVRVWNVSSGEEVFRHTTLYPNRPVFTSDGRGVAFLASGKVLVYDFKSGKERPSPGWCDVATMAPSPGGSWLATAHQDGSIRIRVAQTGEEALRFQADAGAVFRLLWSKDGKKLYSANGDTTVLEWDLAPRTAGKALSAEQAWTDMGSADGLLAYRAAWLFMTSAESMGKLVQLVRPVSDDGSGARIRRLIGELEHDRFAVREAAAKELTGLGPAAEPALRQAAAANTSLELRQRVGKILEQMPAQELTADDYRLLRAVEVLECVVSAPARQKLIELSKGASDALLTRAATAALQRLKSRTSN